MILGFHYDLISLTDDGGAVGREVGLRKIRLLNFNKFRYDVVEGSVCGTEVVLARKLLHLKMPHLLPRSSHCRGGGIGRIGKKGSKLSNSTSRTR